MIRSANHSKGRDSFLLSPSSKPVNVTVVPVRVAVDGGYVRSRRVISRRACSALCHVVCHPD